MKRNILIGLAILAVSTSAGFAAHRPHHGHAMKPKAPATATNPGGASPLLGGQISAADRALYLKNQRDSGIKAKKH